MKQKNNTKTLIKEETCRCGKPMSQCDCEGGCLDNSKAGCCGGGCCCG